METPFKKSSISEMCNQICSAPVIFKKTNGEECLAFYNNENPVEATKLYILFPGSSFPKYIEGNDIYNVKDCILHNVTIDKATALYSQSCKLHKPETVNFITGLIKKSPFSELAIPLNSNEAVSTEHITDPHVIYNKKHACGLVKIAGAEFPTMAIMKDLKDKTASEVIIEGVLEYNVAFDTVFWAARISSKEFTDYKIKLRLWNA